MLKRFFAILAVAAMAAMAFVGCSKDKDTDNLADKIVGKWITTDFDGTLSELNDLKQ